MKKGCLITELVVFLIVSILVTIFLVNIYSNKSTTVFIGTVMMLVLFGILVTIRVVNINKTLFFKSDSASSSVKERTVFFLKKTYYLSLTHLRYIIGVFIIVVVATIYLVHINNIDNRIDNWIEDYEQNKLNDFLFGQQFEEYRNDERYIKIIEAAYENNLSEVIDSIDYQIINNLIPNSLRIEVLKNISKNKYKVNKIIRSIFVEEYALKSSEILNSSYFEFIKSQDKGDILSEIIKNKLKLVQKRFDNPTNKIVNLYENLNNIQSEILNYSITQPDSQILVYVKNGYHNPKIEAIELKITEKNTELIVIRSKIDDLESDLSSKEKFYNKMIDRKEKVEESLWISGYITDEVSPLFPAVARRNECAGLYELNSGRSLALVCMQDHIFNRQGYISLKVRYIGQEIAVNEYSGHRISLPLYVELTELEKKYEIAVNTGYNKAKNEFINAKNSAKPKINYLLSQKANLEKQLAALSDDKDKLHKDIDNIIEDTCEKMVASYGINNVNF